MTLAQELIRSQSAGSVVDACRRVVAKYFGDMTWKSPVELEGLARSKNIAIEYDPRLTSEGRLERDSFGRAIITVRPHGSLRRRRFTIAHEIGHWILQEEIDTLRGGPRDRLFPGLSAGSEEVAEEEFLANLLAAELLLPYQWIMKHVDLADTCLAEELRRICKAQRVSRPTAIRRIADVFDETLLYLELIPRRFNDLRSSAEIDDAILAKGNGFTLYDGGLARLETPMAFADLGRDGGVDLAVWTSNGLVEGTFRVDTAKQPVPHAFALAPVLKNSFGSCEGSARVWGTENQEVD